jgi:electron transfer flavoprotein alpha subunit
MPDTILVVVEQRESKLNRVSWETITAGQAIAAATGWNLEAAVVGADVASMAAEIAAKKVSKVYAVTSSKLEPYTPDAFSRGTETVAGGSTAETRAYAAYLSSTRLRS